MTIIWPNRKEFAFSIVDDTDFATVKNVKPIYDYLYDKGIKTTKTVWCYPSRDKYSGESLSDLNYRIFIKSLYENGFEIAFHGVGSGEFKRQEIESGLQLFHDIIGSYPKMYINHASNPEGLYWGNKRFSIPLKQIYDLIKVFLGKPSVVTSGEDEDSKFFWGDYAKEHIKYIRNRVFSGINTFKYDPYMPYIEESKKYSNYWFSSSDGYNCRKFNSLLSQKNINKLVSENGCAIIYTHFAYDFIEKDGNLNKSFIEAMDYISELNGWFAPASEILDYIQQQRDNDKNIKNVASLKMDCRWACERAIRKVVWRV